MVQVACRLTAKNRDQLRNPTLGNRVWATFTFHITLQVMQKPCTCDFLHGPLTSVHSLQLVTDALTSGTEEKQVEVFYYKKDGE